MSRLRISPSFCLQLLFHHSFFCLTGPRLYEVCTRGLGLLHHQQVIIISASCHWMRPLLLHQHPHHPYLSQQRKMHRHAVLFHHATEAAAEVAVTLPSLLLTPPSSIDNIDLPALTAPCCRSVSEKLAFAFAPQRRTSSQITSSLTTSSCSTSCTHAGHRHR